jgi:nicotinamidase-related amidase
MGNTGPEKESWFEPAELEIYVKDTAYLSMDLSVSALRGERSKVSILGQHAREQNLLTNCRKALEASRAADVYVVHVRHTFRPGYPEYGEQASPFWKRVRESGAYIDGTPGTEICEEVAPKATEPLITKNTVDPFIYSDLDKILRVRGIKYIVLTGIATSNVIEGTVRAGSDRGYVPIVLEDCVADYTKEMHRFQIEHLLPMHSIISNSAKYIEALWLATK